MHQQTEHVRKWRLYVFVAICGLMSTPAIAITPEGIHVKNLNTLF